MRYSILSVAVILPLALIGGCTPTPPPLPPPSLGEQATASNFETQRAKSLAAVADVTPASEKIGGSLLVVIPNKVSTRQSIDRIMPKATEFVRATATEDVHDISRARALAVEKSALFDQVTIVESETPALVRDPPTDYRLQPEMQPNGRFAWFLRREESKGLRGLSVPPRGYTEGIDMLNAFNVSIINAAADLGVTIARQPFPSGQHGGGAGTVFFVDTNGHAVTNAHVVEGCKSATVALPEGAQADATIVATDHQNDLALVKLASHAGPIAHFRANPPVRQGEDVVVFGYPYAGALAVQGSLSTGVVSTLTGLHEDSRIFQVTAPVQPGNSGGPVLDSHGMIIGVIEAKLNALNIARLTGDIPQNINFAIKGNIVTNFLETNGISYGTTTPTKDVATADIGNTAKSFTALIKCVH